MILIDTNTLILLVLGAIDPKLLKDNEKTTVFEEEDYELAMIHVGKLENLIVLPNILTEVDNLLNKEGVWYKYQYKIIMQQLAEKATEEYLESKLGIKHDYFGHIGLTDVLILSLKDKYDELITADTKLADRARGFGIKVTDMKFIANLRLK